MTQNSNFYSILFSLQPSLHSPLLFFLLSPYLFFSSSSFFSLIPPHLSPYSDLCLQRLKDIINIQSQNIYFWHRALCVIYVCVVTVIAGGNTLQLGGNNNRNVFILGENVNRICGQVHTCLSHSAASDTTRLAR